MIVAHRGYSSRQPEMTRAAYEEAVSWSAARQIRLGLECDVQFSGDGELICLHDLTVDRTSNATGRARDLSFAELKQLDFGSWYVPDPSPAQRELLGLVELMELVRDARRAGAPVELVIETKHPGGRGREVEERVADLVTAFGWDHPGSPVRLLSFSVKAVRRFGWLLPALQRTLLIEDDLGPWRKGKLPDGVQVVGPELALLRADPGFVARSQARGHQVHAWTVNEPEDVARCHALGVTGFTTDDPERVATALCAASI